MIIGDAMVVGRAVHVRPRTSARLGPLPAVTVRFLDDDPLVAHTQAVAYARGGWPADLVRPGWAP